MGTFLVSTMYVWHSLIVDTKEFQPLAFSIAKIIDILEGKVLSKYLRPSLVFNNFSFISFLVYGLVAFFGNQTIFLHEYTNRLCHLHIHWVTTMQVFFKCLLNLLAICRVEAAISYL